MRKKILNTAISIAEDRGLKKERSKLNTSILSRGGEITTREKISLVTSQEAVLRLLSLIQVSLKN